MGYIIGPIVAAVISIAYSETRCKKRCAENLRALEERVTLVETKVKDYDNEMTKKLMGTLLPVAKEVTKLKQAVGI